VLEVAFNVAEENVACSNLFVTYGGVNYGLLQMHFHSPSEHTIGNGRFAAEAHMVHKSASGGYLVIGVFLHIDEFDTVYAAQTNDDKNEYDDGINRNNKFLNSIWRLKDSSGISPVKTFMAGGKNLDQEGDELLNPYKDLTPPRNSMYHYVGGLTTPPCVVPGGVSWWVYDEPVTVSYADIYYLRKIVQSKGNYLSNRGDNARPVQPVNGRLVSYIPAIPYPPTPSPSFKPTKAEAPPLDVGIILGAIALAIAVIACFIAVYFGMNKSSPIAPAR
jgi:carbonic anhydrase